jgi:hypothetical protein
MMMMKEDEAQGEVVDDACANQPGGVHGEARKFPRVADSEWVALLQY